LTGLCYLKCCFCFFRNTTSSSNHSQSECPPRLPPEYSNALLEPLVSTSSSVSRPPPQTSLAASTIPPTFALDHHLRTPPIYALGIHSMAPMIGSSSTSAQKFGRPASLPKLTQDSSSRLTNYVNQSWETLTRSGTLTPTRPSQWFQTPSRLVSPESSLTIS